MCEKENETDSLTKNKEFIHGKHTCITEEYNEHKKTESAEVIYVGTIFSRMKIILVAFISVKNSESKEITHCRSVQSFMSPVHIEISRPATSFEFIERESKISKEKRPSKINPLPP